MVADPIEIVPGVRCIGHGGGSDWTRWALETTPQVTAAIERGARDSGLTPDEWLVQNVANLTAPLIASEGAPSTELAVDLLRRVYEMLRDSTPGPLTDDMPVRPLLREARSFLDQFGSDDG